jgi:hypothetical protein
MFTFRLLTDKTSNQSSRTKQAVAPPNEPKLSHADPVTQHISATARKPEQRTKLIRLSKIILPSARSREISRRLLQTADNFLIECLFN